jgi:collagenase-like PrtC family protease
MESWELYSGEEKWENSVALKNDAFFLLEDIPHLISLNVECLKVQGREYPVPLVERMVRFYRDLIDDCLASPSIETFDLAPWRSRLASIQMERDTARSDGTRQLLMEARQPLPVI